MKHKFIPIPKTTNYFIHRGGYVIKISSGEEKRVAPVIRGNRRPMVMINNVEKELLYLMIECFNIKYTPYDKIQYTVNFEGAIPLNSIIITPLLDRPNFAPSKTLTPDEEKIILYGCVIKSTSCNARGKGIISPLEILNILKVSNFRCVYCDTVLDPRKWHVDHVHPISKGGNNKYKNIVPSCPTCNSMKHDLPLATFIKMCKRIYLKSEANNIVNKLSHHD